MELGQYNTLDPGKEIAHLRRHSFIVICGFSKEALFSVSKLHYDASFLEST